MRVQQCAMNFALPVSYVRLSDKAFLQLKSFGNSLKPIDEEKGWFFQIIFELIDATLTNYDQLKIGYSSENNHKCNFEKTPVRFISSFAIQAKGSMLKLHCKGGVWV